MEAVNERTAGQYRAGEHRDCAELAEITVRRRTNKNDCETLSLRRRWRNVERDHRRSAPGSRYRRGGVAGGGGGVQKNTKRFFRGGGLFGKKRLGEKI